MENENAGSGAGNIKETCKQQTMRSVTYLTAPYVC